MQLPVDAALVEAWLTARSLARGLPPPVADRGGFRVETKSEKEVRRWVFAAVGPGLHDVAQSVSEPRNLIKLCAPAETLRAALPRNWQVEDGSWFMAREGGQPEAPSLPSGYWIERDFTDGVVAVRIIAMDGELAASGFGAEAGGYFVYDRIVTEPAHRRRGLGRILMASIGSARVSAGSWQLLVASTDGEKLYSTLGWKILSPYATASLAVPSTSETSD